MSPGPRQQGGSHASDGHPSHCAGAGEGGAAPSAVGQYTSLHHPTWDLHTIFLCTVFVFSAGDAETA